MIPLTMKQRESSAFYYMLALNYRQERQNFRTRTKGLRDYLDIIITQEMALGILAKNKDADKPQGTIHR